MKYDTPDPPKAASVEKAKNEVLDVLKKMENGLTLQAWVRDTNEDIEDLVTYSKFKSDENKMKGVVKCLKFLSQQLESQIKIRPVLCFNENSLVEIRESVEAVFAGSMGFDNPIGELSFSSFFFKSDMISSPKDYEYIRSLIDEDGSANIIQRVFVSTRGTKIQELVSAIENYPRTLIILRTCHKNIIGAHTDKLWTRKINPNYRYDSSYNSDSSDQNISRYLDDWKSSDKSVIFDLDEKQVLRVRPKKMYAAMFCPADLSKGIQLGGGPDLFLLNNGTTGLKVSLDPGDTYYPSNAKDQQESEKILIKFAGGKNNRTDAVVAYLEVFAIINPEKDAAPTT